MDGASRMFAAPVEITLGGRKLQVNPRVAHLRAKVEQHILESRPNPLQVARENMKAFSGDPAMQAELMRLGMEMACKAKSVNQGDFAEWINTVEGTIYVLWLQTRDCNAPPPTLEEVREAYDEEVESVVREITADSPSDQDVSQAAGTVLERIHDKINRASGEDELGNSTGPPNGAGRTTGETSPSPGGESAGS